MSTPPSLPGPLWEIVAATIRERILSGELLPGTKLVETEYAEEFGTSRGPIREAIRELAREGLVAELSRRGTFVSALNAHDLSELYDVREGLELVACRAVIARVDDDEVAGLERHLVALESSWSQGASYLESAIHDLEFHRGILMLSRNQRMAAVYDQMLAQTLLLLRAAAEESPRLREGMRPSAHRDILAALRARDEKRVRLAIEAHYRYAGERLFGRGAARRGGLAAQPEHAPAARAPHRPSGEDDA